MTAAKNPLQKLAGRGQSIWLDFISRQLVTTPELQRLLDEDNVTGLTSNPTIFEKAIAEGSDYDEHLRELVRDGVASPDELFLGIAISDIQHAADTLRPVWERTKGVDGYVSLELPPSIAADTAASVSLGKELKRRVDRPNLMVKVPATDPGVPAIQQLISAGVNINVTLIFAIESYENVINAYIAGLEERAERGESLDVHSVASFFVSRVDTAVDPLLQAKVDAGDDVADLLGRAAVANAQLAYEKFEDHFRNGARFKALARKGASVQRPLWASTSAKNPKYRDVLYAESLIGPDTVDTMPPATIEAFRDHGIADKDTVNADYAGAHDVMDRLGAAGIDMQAVTRKLLEDGLHSFAASYDSLVRRITEKADSFRRGYATRQLFELGDATDAVDAALTAPAAQEVVRGIWKRDPDTWKPGDAKHAAVINNRLGWLDVTRTMRENLPLLLRTATEIREEGTTDVVLLGMGGSSLGPEVLRTALGSSAGYPTLHVIDTTDPAAVNILTDSLDPRTTVFVVASKSGGTLETLSHMAHFWDLVSTAGVPDVGRHFIAVTDAGTSLAEHAKANGFRHVFENPGDIGGRYSVLSFFGMVPAALAGIDVEDLLNRAEAMAAACAVGTPADLNPGLRLGTVMGVLHGRGRDKVTILAPARVAAFSLWAEQLIAESTGKEQRGIIPIGAEPIGAPPVYGSDRLFVALELGDDPEFSAAVGALRTAHQPVVTLRLEDAYDVAAEFFRWEFATAVAATHLHIDPFDEPNVAESKENTKKVLARYEETGSLEVPASSGDTERADGAGDVAAEVRAFLGQVEQGDYVSLQAYVPPTQANSDALQALRVVIRDAQVVATTLGFGPRFLHSTGQLHKGGPNTIVAIQVTQDDTVDVPIPGQPFTFSTLKQAQAIGDLQSLKDHGRRALRVHISGDVAEHLTRLAESLATAGAAR